MKFKDEILLEIIYEQFDFTPGVKSNKVSINLQPVFIIQVDAELLKQSDLLRINITIENGNVKNYSHYTNFDFYKKKLRKYKLERIIK